MLIIGTGVGIPGKNFFSGKVLSNLFIKLVKLFRIEGNVDIPPPNLIFGNFIFYNKTIFWGTAGELTGVNCQCTICGFYALFPVKSFLLKLFGA